MAKFSSDYATDFYAAISPEADPFTSIVRLNAAIRIGTPLFIQTAATILPKNLLF